MGFFPSSGELDALTPVGYSNASLTIPESVFLDAANEFFPGIPDKLLRQGAAIRVGSAECQRLQVLVTRLNNEMYQNNSLMSDLRVREVLEQDLLNHFMEALRSGWSDLTASTDKPSGKRFALLRRAIDLMESCPPDQLDASMLCREFGVSRRRVEMLFRDTLGISPCAIIRNLRLNAVRYQLLEAENTAGSVKQAALDAGFWHMGHFCEQYSSLFGERPSDTLARQGM